MRLGTEVASLANKQLRRNDWTRLAQRGESAR